MHNSDVKGNIFAFISIIVVFAKGYGVNRQHSLFVCLLFFVCCFPYF